MASGRAIRLGTGLWVDGPVSVNPADGTVLVDTTRDGPAPLAAGTYLFAVQGGGNVASIFAVQQRDATNTITKHSQKRYPAAGDEDFIMAGSFDLLLNERLRVVLIGAIPNGEVQLSIYVQPVL